MRMLPKNTVFLIDIILLYTIHIIMNKMRMLPIKRGIYLIEIAQIKMEQHQHIH